MNNANDEYADQIAECEKQLSQLEATYADVIVAYANYADHKAQLKSRRASLKSKQSRARAVLHRIIPSDNHNWDEDKALVDWDYVQAHKCWEGFVHIYGVNGGAITAFDPAYVGERIDTKDEKENA